MAENIIPLIDMRRLWRDEKERLYDERWENLYETEVGELLCYCPVTGTRRSLVHDGYDRCRKAQRRMCPAEAFGVTCQGKVSRSIPTVLRLSVMKDPGHYLPHAGIAGSGRNSIKQVLP